MAGSAPEEGACLGTQVGVDPFGAHPTPETCRIDVVETPVDIQEQSGNFPLVHLEGSDRMGEGVACVHH